ncbi:MAG: hypothetical protein V1826_01275 [bacterium]
MMWFRHLITRGVNRCWFLVVHRLPFATKRLLRSRGKTLEVKSPRSASDLLVELYAVMQEIRSRCPAVSSILEEKLSGWIQRRPWSAYDQAVGWLKFDFQHACQAGEFKPFVVRELCQKLPQLQLNAEDMVKLLPKPPSEAELVPAQ